MENTLCTLRDLARRFRHYGLSMSWLRAEAEAGRLPCFKVGRRLLFHADAVEGELIKRAMASRVTARRKP